MQSKINAWRLEIEYLNLMITCLSRLQINISPQPSDIAHHEFPFTFNRWLL